MTFDRGKGIVKGIVNLYSGGETTYLNIQGCTGNTNYTIIIIHALFINSDKVWIITATDSRWNRFVFFQ